MKITKKAKIAFIKEKLKSDDNWAKKALLRIYENQTAAEQESGETVENNGIGFTGVDANILTSFAEGLKKYGNLTVKQMAYLHKAIVKYAGQIYNISDDEKLERIMQGK